jgi:hypothetical protein
MEDRYHDKKKYPVMYFLFTTTSILFFRYINNPLYVIRCHLWSKYNRVTVKSLPPTWNDRDTLLEHACFQILTDFVDKERPETLKETYRSVLEEYSEPGFSVGWCDDTMEFAKERALSWAILRKCYYFHKHRDDIENKLWLTYVQTKGTKKHCVQTYSRYVEKIERLEDKFLRELVANRKLLWT